jgi:hypothetical protein
MTEPQTIWYCVQFQAEHKPDDINHLRHVADTHFKSKGVIIRDKNIII